MVYATCSVLKRENSDQIRKFLIENPQWRIIYERRFTHQIGEMAFTIAICEIINLVTAK